MNDKTCQYGIEPLARVLLASAALLAALAFVQVARYWVAVSDADSLVAVATRPGSGQPAAPDATAKVVVDAIKKNNLFAPTAPKQFPVNEVAGILGNQALINGQWYSAGDTLDDAKILAVEPTKVRVTWNGQEKEFTPMASTGAGGREGPERRGGPPAPKGAGVVVTGGRPESGPPAPMAGMSTGEREQMRERFRNMTPEERQKYREEMRARYSRRGGNN